MCFGNPSFDVHIKRPIVWKEGVDYGEESLYKITWRQYNDIRTTIIKAASEDLAQSKFLQQTDVSLRDVFSPVSIDKIDEMGRRI